LLLLQLEILKKKRQLVVLECVRRTTFSQVFVVAQLRLLQLKKNKK